MVTRPHALVLRYHSLGDVVLTTGVVRALHDSGFLVDVVTEERFGSLFDGSPYVAQLFTREEWESAGTKFVSVYDRVIDLQASPGSRRATRNLGPRAAVNTRSLARRWVVATGDRPPRPTVPHAVLRYAEAAFDARFGGPVAPNLEALGPQVAVTEGDRTALSSRLPGLVAPGPRPRVALLTGASRVSKAYPCERFAAVGRAFADRGWDVLWVEAPAGPGTNAERAPCAPVGTRVAVGLGPLKALLSTAQLAVSGDSGPMHLATALGIPVVAVFGSSVRTFGFTPLGARTRVLEVPGLFCRPCGVHGRDRCWRGGFRCLDISPDVVVAAGLELVGEGGGACSAHTGAEGAPGIARVVER